MVAVQVDERYRVTIPKEARAGIRPGDVLFVERAVEHGVPVVRYARADNPFDVLAVAAEREYRARETVGLDEAFAGSDDAPDAE